MKTKEKKKKFLVEIYVVKKLMKSRRSLGLNRIRLITEKEQPHLLEVGILQCISPRP